MCLRMFKPVVLLWWFELFEVFLTIFADYDRTKNNRIRHNEHKSVKLGKKITYNAYTL